VRAHGTRPAAAAAAAAGATTAAAAGWGVTTTSKALQGGAGKKLAFKTKFDPRLWLFGQLSGMVCGQQPLRFHPLRAPRRCVSV
jgi:hypothetical protein